MNTVANLLPGQGPAVSVIIPCYSYDAFLPDACRSLLEQTMQNWECILVNNGSFPATRAVAEKFSKSDSRFIYLETENKGPSAARNSGLQLSSGRYIQFLDADDKLQPKKLQEHAALLDQRPDVDLVYGPVLYFTSEKQTETVDQIGELSRAGKEGHSGSGKQLYSLLLRKNIFVINSPLFRKNLADQCGVFREDLMLLEDWEFWLRISKQMHRFVYCDLPDTTALVRYHASSLSRDSQGMHQHYLPVLALNFNPFTNRIFDSLYVFARFEEELTQSILFKKNRVVRVALSAQFATGKMKKTFLFFFILLPVFFPFYLIIRLYRFIR